MGQSKIIPIKEAKTFTEQLQIIQSRGIVIEDLQEAIAILQNVNYYRLIAYGLTLKKSIEQDQYIEGTTFRQLVSIYEFDKKLRQLLLGMLENIEIAFRTHISYHHVHEYGPLGYTNPTGFANSEYHTKFITNLQRFYDENKTELFVAHHRNKYNGNFPFWVTVEVLSFSALSKLFRNLHNKDKLFISKKYYKTHSKYIQSWLHTLTTIRNICAHHGRLYGKKLTIKPSLFNEIHNKVENDGIFAAVIIISKLLSKKERLNLLTSLIALIEQYEEFIDISYMGFPNDWEKYL